MLYISFNQRLVANENSLYDTVRQHNDFQKKCGYAGIELDKEGYPINTLKDGKDWSEMMDDWIDQNCEIFYQDFDGNFLQDRNLLFWKES